MHKKMEATTMLSIASIQGIGTRVWVAIPLNPKTLNPINLILLLRIPCVWMFSVRDSG